MAVSFVDLHCHSTASDGTASPTEVVELAHESGLTGLSLTDHDTVAGVAEATAAAEKLGIDFIPGIEISAEYPHPGTLHLLGYGIDPSNASLQNLTETLIAGRDNRNPRIVEKLNELGIKVTMQEWEDEAKGGVLGRPQLAAILLRKGVVSTIKEAFNRFLGQGAPAYFDKERLSPRDAMARIREAGGLPVLAHATQLRRRSFPEIETEVKNLLDLGLAGIEVIHSDFNDAEARLFDQLADRYDLLKTGGSDFHGSNKPAIKLGLANGRKIPRIYLDELREAILDANYK